VPPPPPPAHDVYVPRWCAAIMRAWGNMPPRDAQTEWTAQRRLMQAAAIRALLDARWRAALLALAPPPPSAGTTWPPLAPRLVQDFVYAQGAELSAFADDVAAAYDGGTTLRTADGATFALWNAGRTFAALRLAPG
jgi:hypothetical protein